ncbi:unnamed protein product [Symbiodinium natans]|uniref:Uncharacterized protein n=1 Tax=Symbiodinium natans TaxID=878477 RepID=A0A812U101_9DINO|nr:unnamed protein product [Symbiodinium natans]
MSCSSVRSSAHVEHLESFGMAWLACCGCLEVLACSTGRGGLQFFRPLAPECSLPAVKFLDACCALGLVKASAASSGNELWQSWSLGIRLQKQVKTGQGAEAVIPFNPGHDPYFHLPGLNGRPGHCGVLGLVTACVELCTAFSS